MGNPLTDLIPAQYRKYVYLVAAAAVFVYGLWEAAQGDVKAFVIALVSSLVPALAASNTPADGDDEPGDAGGYPEDNLE